MSAELARERARALYEARAAGKPIGPFTDDDPGLGMDDGYAIQQELMRLILADGDTVIGYKVGLTSLPMQRMLGVDSPDHAPVLGSTRYADGGTVALSEFIAPKMEAEIVFVLGERLQGPGVTTAQARAAISHAVAGLEIVDSRIEDWRIGLADTVADLASNGALVLSDRQVPFTDLPDPRLIGMALTRTSGGAPEDELVDTGAGAAALGDPVAVVAWLANVLGRSGVALEAGHVVLTGALHAAVPMRAGEQYRAEFDRLGPVRISVGA